MTSVLLGSARLDFLEDFVVLITERADWQRACPMIPGQLCLYDKQQRVYLVGAK